MNYLLDTQAFIWMDSGSTNLSSKVRDVLLDRNNVLFLSVVSVWEMQIKYSLGKLHLRSPLPQLIADQQKNGVLQLSVELKHIFELAKLPLHHGDPFDRLLVAQARVENLQLITADRKLTQYEVNVFW
jgi:PIN domain nuclease of toxin-antitoxin system